MDRITAIASIEYVREKCQILGEQESPHDFFGTICEALSMAIEALQEPEIVHCKDCKLRKLEECAMQYECDCGEQHSWENDNDYCSWGIKAGEQE